MTNQSNEPLAVPHARRSKPNPIDPARLHDMFVYEPETGKLFWKERPVSMFTNTKMTAEAKAKWWNSRFSGKEAFTDRNEHGYCVTNIGGSIHRAHRVIWAMVKGYWPIGVDHDNGVRDDNRWLNLVEKTQAENMRNVRRRSNNTSGRTGVFRAGSRWGARIGKSNLGTFDTFDAACLARQAAEQENGYHARHGK